MAATKNFLTKRNGILFGAMIVVAIGMMVVFIVGMMNSSMAIALGGFFGGAALLVVIMMIFVFGGKDKNKDKLVKIEGRDRKGPTTLIETNNEQIDWYKTKELVYQGKITTGEAICPVCKLAIKEKEAMVMQCPQCLSLYHGEHFIEWLMEHQTCPVCSIEIEVRK